MITTGAPELYRMHFQAERDGELNVRYVARNRVKAYGEFNESGVAFAVIGSIESDVANIRHWLKIVLLRTIFAQQPDFECRTSRSRLYKSRPSNPAPAVVLDAARDR